MILPLLAAMLLFLATVAPTPAAEEIGQNLVLELRLAKDAAYPHEAVAVTVTLLAGAPVRNIQFPHLAGTGFRRSGFAPPRQSNVVRDGREYTAYEFAASLVAGRSGVIDLGPAELGLEVLAPAAGAAAFYGESQPRRLVVRSTPIRFTVLPLPLRGRPAGFDGVVGHFTLSREVAPTLVTSGEAVTVTTRMVGTGNICTHACEPIALPGMRAYPPQTRCSKGRLTCEQVLLPETAGDAVIPGGSLLFFDPSAHHYRTATSAPVPIRVIGMQSKPAARPALSITYRGSVAERPRPYRWGLVGVLLAVVGGVLVRYWWRRSMPVQVAATCPSLAEVEATLAAADPDRFYAAVFRLVQARAVAHADLPAAGATAGPFATAAPPCDPIILDLFHECDAVRYGLSPRSQADMLRAYEKLRMLFPD